MSKRMKLIEKLLKKAPDYDYNDIRIVLESFGYEPRVNTGSHVAFINLSDKKEPPLIVPTKKGRRVKKYIVKTVIDRLSLEEWYESETGKRSP